MPRLDCKSFTALVALRVCANEQCHQKSVDAALRVVAVILATLTAYDSRGRVLHKDTRQYPGLGLLWEHIGCQQNNRKTLRVEVLTEAGLEYRVQFSKWTPARRFSPSPRFHELLATWGGLFC